MVVVCRVPPQHFLSGRQRCPHAVAVIEVRQIWQPAASDDQPAGECSAAQQHMQLVGAALLQGTQSSAIIVLSEDTAVQLHEACAAMLTRGAALLHASPAFSRSITESLCSPTPLCMNPVLQHLAQFVSHPCLADLHIAHVKKGHLCTSVRRQCQLLTPLCEGSLPADWVLCTAELATSSAQEHTASCCVADKSSPTPVPAHA